MTENKVVYFVAQTILDVIFFTGLFLNASVIFVLLCSRSPAKQRASRSYMVHFSVANLCFLLGVPLFVIRLRFSSFWPASMVVCKLDNGLYSVIPFTIAAFLAILSINQYLEVCRPMTAKRWKTSSLFDTVSLLVWCISGILMTPLFLYTDMRSNAAGSIFCVVEWPDVGLLSGETASVLFRFILGFAIPIPICIVFIVVTIRHLQFHPEEARLHDWNNTKLVLVYLVAYVVCWWPHWVYHLIHFSEYLDNYLPTHVMVTLWIVSESMIYTNSALCPLLYAYISDDFKRSFLEACACCCRSRLKIVREEDGAISQQMSQRESYELKSSLETPSRDQLSQTDTFQDLGPNTYFQNGSIVGHSDSITQTASQEFVTSETQTAEEEEKKKKDCTETEL